MALGDYILCCKCDTKLLYDGDRGNREWWEERFGAEPAILCPNCDKREWKEWNAALDEAAARIGEIKGFGKATQHSFAVFIQGLKR